MIREIDAGIFYDIHLCLETVSKEYPDGNILSNKLLAFHHLGQHHFKKNVINLNEFYLLILRYIFLWKFLIFDTMYNLKHTAEWSPVCIQIGISFHKKIFHCLPIIRYFYIAPIHCFYGHPKLIVCLPSLDQLTHKTVSNSRCFN